MTVFTPTHHVLLMAIIIFIQNYWRILGQCCGLGRTECFYGKYN